MLDLQPRTDTVPVGVVEGVAGSALAPEAAVRVHADSIATNLRLTETLVDVHRAASADHIARVRPTQLFIASYVKHSG